MFSASTQVPLQWPSHFPPKDRWKKFFIGVRGLGPDLAFFGTLERVQGERSREVMQQWPAWPAKKMAFLLGTVLRMYVRWPKPYFLPTDEFRVAAYGPKFQDTDDLGFDAATKKLEDHLGLKLSSDFWDSTFDLTFGDVVLRLLEAHKARRAV